MFGNINIVISHMFFVIVFDSVGFASINTVYGKQKASDSVA